MGTGLNRYNQKSAVNQFIIKAKKSTKTTTTTTTMTTKPATTAVNQFIIVPDNDCLGSDIKMKPNVKNIDACIEFWNEFDFSLCYLFGSFKVNF